MMVPTQLAGENGMKNTKKRARETSQAQTKGKKKLGNAHHFQGAVIMRVDHRFFGLSSKGGRKAIG